MELAQAYIGQPTARLEMKRERKGEERSLGFRKLGRAGPDFCLLMSLARKVGLGLTRQSRVISVFYSRDKCHMIDGLLGKLA